MRIVGHAFKVNSSRRHGNLVPFRTFSMPCPERYGSATNAVKVARDRGESQPAQIPAHVSAQRGGGNVSALNGPSGFPSMSSVTFGLARFADQPASNAESLCTSLYL
jgi:hypothetical protein